VKCDERASFADDLTSRIASQIYCWSECGRACSTMRGPLLIGGEESSRYDSSIREQYGRGKESQTAWVALMLKKREISEEVGEAGSYLCQRNFGSSALSRRATRQPSIRGGGAVMF
jgi:hypothetical protein